MKCARATRRVRARINRNRERNPRYAEIGFSRERTRKSSCDVRRTRDHSSRERNVPFSHANARVRCSFGDVTYGMLLNLLYFRVERVRARAARFEQLSKETGSSFIERERVIYCVIFCKVISNPP